MVAEEVSDLPAIVWELAQQCSQTEGFLPACSEDFIRPVGRVAVAYFAAVRRWFCVFVLIVAFRPSLIISQLHKYKFSKRPPCLPADPNQVYGVHG